jgi:hypothetical protein
MAFSKSQNNLQIDLLLESAPEEAHRNSFTVCIFYRQATEMRVVNIMTNIFIVGNTCIRRSCEAVERKRDLSLQAVYNFFFISVHT